MKLVKGWCYYEGDTENAMKVYKIRRKSDGLFSLGGERPRFGKRGKMWTGEGRLACHLTQSASWYKPVIDDIEIVEFELKEAQIKNFAEVLMTKMAAKEKRELAAKARSDVRKKQRLEAQRDRIVADLEALW